MNDIESVIQLMHETSFLEAIDHAFTLMAFTEDRKTSQTAEFLKFCSASQNKSSFLSEQYFCKNTITENLDLNLTNLPWLHVEQYQECHHNFGILREAFQNMLALYQMSDKQRRQIKHSLEGLLNAPYDLPLETKATIQFSQNSLNLFSDCMTLGAKLTKAGTLNAALKYANEIVCLFKEFNQNESLAEKVKELFDWKYLENAGIDLFWKDYTTAKDLASTLKTNIYRLMTELGDMLNILNQKVTPSVLQAQGYQNKTITKLELSEALTTKSMKDTFDQLSFSNILVKSFIKDRVQLFRMTSINLWEAYKTLSDLSLPLLNRNNAHQLNLIQAIIELNESKSPDVLKGFPESINDALVLSYERVKNFLRQAGSNVTNLVDEFLQYLERLCENLNEYKQSQVMDSSFYQ